MARIGHGAATHLGILPCVKGTCSHTSFHGSTITRLRTTPLLGGEVPPGGTVDSLAFYDTQPSETEHTVLKCWAGGI